MRAPYAVFLSSNTPAGLYARQGDWGVEIPFYRALNALAHLHSPAADRQTMRAIDHLSATQQADGFWGASQRLWCPFLAVHALRNKGMVLGRRLSGCRIRHEKTVPIAETLVNSTADRYLSTRMIVLWVGITEPTDLNERVSRYAAELE